jgi:MoxR-like ATPase
MTDDATPDATQDLERLERLGAQYRDIRTEIAKVIKGQDEVVEMLLIGIFSNGHCMLEGVPGLAKTLLISTLAECLDLSFARIQFTPDLMPSDITGTEVMQEDRTSGTREFKFMRGPIFNNVVLADEINRTPPKTQAALLEGMQERQVSAAGQRHALPAPFFVLSTQNPIEQEGTYPLPEAQLDRFLFKINVDYPEREVERAVYRTLDQAEPEKIRRVMGADDILAAQRLVRRIPMNDTIVDYALNLARVTRVNHGEAPDWIREWVMIGSGPRAGMALLTGAKTRAALAGRPEVDVEDVRAVAQSVLRHRIVLNYSAEAEGQTPDSVVARMLESVPVHAAQEGLGVSVQKVLKP